jgi:hypothetical protein
VPGVALLTLKFSWQISPLPLLIIHVVGIVVTLGPLGLTLKVKVNISPGVPPTRNNPPLVEALLSNFASVARLLTNEPMLLLSTELSEAVKVF